MTHHWNQAASGIGDPPGGPLIWGEIWPWIDLGWLSVTPADFYGIGLYHLKNIVQISVLTNLSVVFRATTVWNDHAGFVHQRWLRVPYVPGVWSMKWCELIIDYAVCWCLLGSYEFHQKSDWWTRLSWASRPRVLLEQFWE